MQGGNSASADRQNDQMASRPLISAILVGGRRIRAVLGITVFLVILWPVLASRPAMAAAGSDRLLPGETLQPGQGISSGGDTFTMQNDGNLVLYAPGKTALWASNTSGNNGALLSMQPNGSLVVSASGGKQLWASGTPNHSGSELILQPDGNAVIDTPGNIALWSTNTYKQTYADNQLPVHGWGAGQASQFGCLNNIWVRESNWNQLAGNPKSAYGIPQASPGNKMAAEGSDWLTDPQTQIRWGEDYIQGRYGSPCQAWTYWQAHRSYLDHPATSAASSAPSSQQASRSCLAGGPVTQTGGRTARHCRPAVIDSTARTAPPVSLPPCTYRP